MQCTEYGKRRSDSGESDEPDLCQSIGSVRSNRRGNTGIDKKRRGVLRLYGTVVWYQPGKTGYCNLVISSHSITLFICIYGLFFHAEAW